MGTPKEKGRAHPLCYGWSPTGPRGYSRACPVCGRHAGSFLTSRVNQLTSPLRLARIYNVAWVALEIPRRQSSRHPDCPFQNPPSV